MLLYFHVQNQKKKKKIPSVDSSQNLKNLTLGPFGTNTLEQDFFQKIRQLLFTVTVPNKDSGHTKCIS